MSKPNLYTLFKQVFSYLFLILFPFACGEASYILREDTPPIDNGFYGFRWTTPMSIVEKEFPVTSDAKPVSKLNTFNTSHFKGGNFLGERVNTTKFTFNESGLRAVSINVTANQYSYENILYRMLENLIAFYGEPFEQFAIVEFPNIPDFLIKYSWSEKRLQLILRPDYSIEIRAFFISPLRGPIYNYFED